MARAMHCEKAQIFHVPPSKNAMLPQVLAGRPRLHQPGSSLKLVFWVFMEASLHNGLNHWPLVTEHNLQSLSPPWRWRVTLKIVTLSSHDWLLWRPAPLFRQFPKVTSLT